MDARPDRFKKESRREIQIKFNTSGQCGDCGDKDRGEHSIFNIDFGRARPEITQVERIIWPTSLFSLVRYLVETNMARSLIAFPNKMNKPADTISWHT